MNSMDRRTFMAAAGSSGAACLASASTGKNAQLGRQVLLVHLVGGPSQIDTWDPKPDASVECRGPFRSIPTRIPGVRLTELFPHLADRLDRVCLVRTLHHNADPIHETGFRLLHTGCATDQTAAPVGSCVSGRGGVAPWVVVPGPISTLGQAAGVGQDGAIASGSWPIQVGAMSVDSMFSQAVGALEQGARMVTVNTAETVFNRITWDCHADLGALAGTLSDYRNHLAPALDHGLARLIDTLENKGLWDNVLLVVTGEMGRSPRLNSRGGRDHWTGAWTGLLAGAGVPRGVVVGSTDRDGAFPVENPVSLERLHGLMGETLGLFGQTTKEIWS